MDAETRAAFARIDRYFELNQVQITELRQEVAAQGEVLHALSGTVQTLGVEVQTLGSEVKTLGSNVQNLHNQVQTLAGELRSLRSWTEAGFVRIRDELRSFRAAMEDRLAQLTIRVERLERRLDDMRV